MSNAGTSPAAGWYQDPTDATHYRWWDGAAWTENRAPMQAEAAPVAAVPTPVSDPQLAAVPQQAQVPLNPVPHAADELAPEGEFDLPAGDGSKRTKIMLVVLAVVAIGAGAFYFMNRGGGDPPAPATDPAAQTAQTQTPAGAPNEPGVGTPSTAAGATPPTGGNAAAPPAGGSAPDSAPPSAPAAPPAGGAGSSVPSGTPGAGAQGAAPAAGTPAAPTA